MISKYINELIKSTKQYLYQPINPACLTYFRVCFGILISWQAWMIIDQSWAWTLFTQKSIYFKYWPLEFITPLNPTFMISITIVMGICGILVAAGILYKPSTLLIFIIFTYIFLIEKSRYENHLYLICLISFIMMFIPAGKHQTFSDISKTKPLDKPTLSTWPLFLIRTQIGIVYFFAGIAKLNMDWVFKAEPINLWMSNYSGPHILEQIATQPFIPWVMTYTAITIDILAFPLLCYRRTRTFIYFLIIIFHLFNAHLFGVGIFPFLMILSTAIFFDDQWPHRLINDIKTLHYKKIFLLIIGATVGFALGSFLYIDGEHPIQIAGAIGMAIFFYNIDEPFKTKNHVSVNTIDNLQYTRMPTRHEIKKNIVTTIIIVWIIIQIIIPLRHLLIPGNVNWTNEGHYFSWRMKLNNKEAEGNFTITDNVNNVHWDLDPHLFLTGLQYETMMTRPNLILQFVKFVKTYLNDNGYPDITIKSNIKMSLNGKPANLLIDENTDLTKVSSNWLKHSKWISNETKN